MLCFTLADASIAAIHDLLPCVFSQDLIALPLGATVHRKKSNFGAEIHEQAAIELVDVRARLEA